MDKQQDAIYCVYILNIAQYIAPVAGVERFELPTDGVRGSIGEGKSGNFCAGKIVKKLPLLAEKQAKTY